MLRDMEENQLALAFGLRLLSCGGRDKLPDSEAPRGGQLMTVKSSMKSMKKRKRRKRRS
jgi:hypothetical protein